jgi:predicted kinase
MELVIFIGIQATGKSTFYKEKFYNSHIRVNLDMLRSRHREEIIANACVEARQPFVIDNTNPTIADRKRYIMQCKLKGFKIIGYYFQSSINEAIERNSRRTGKEFVNELGIKNTFSKLEVPNFDEGFNKLYYVKIGENNSFIVEEWKYE